MLRDGGYDHRLGSACKASRMAQRWLEMAGETFGDRLFNALIDDFNERQMVDPLKA
jgi:hypothetical protein